MAHLKIIFADPQAAVIRSPKQILFCCGCRPQDIEMLSQVPLASDQLIERACVTAPEATILKLEIDKDIAHEMSVWRSINSKHEIFFSTRADGSVFVCDTMRNAIATTPPSERFECEDSVLDHLIFRRVPLQGSLLKGWHRTAPGERIRLHIDSGSVERKNFDKVTGNVTEMKPEDRLDQLDATLSEIMAPLKGDTRVASLFSGGVDSTLLYTYLTKDTPAISALPETLEPNEKIVLDQALSLLHLEPDFIPNSSADYLAKLESTIEVFGVPPELDQIAFYSDLYRREPVSFISGGVADSLFGSYPMTGWSGMLMVTLIRMGGVGLTRAGSRLAIGKIRERLVEKAEWAEEFRKGLNDLEGAAALEDTFTNFDVMNRLFGDDRIAARLEERLNGILALVELSAPKNNLFLQHMELMHWLGFIANGSALQERQHAFGHGKSLYLPFTDRRLMDFLSAVPVQDRYLSDSRQAKPWLKYLLARRLPGYPVYAQKGTTQYPMRNFFGKTGPLAKVWDKYDLPEPFRSGAEKTLRDEWSDLNWNVLGYAIWRDRVLKNGHLAITTNAQTHVYSLAAS